MELRWQFLLYMSQVLERAPLCPRLIQIREGMQYITEGAFCKADILFMQLADGLTNSHEMQTRGPWIFTFCFTALD